MILNGHLLWGARNGLSPAYGYAGLKALRTEKKMDSKRRQSKSDYYYANKEKIVEQQKKRRAKMAGTDKKNHLSHETNRIKQHCR